MGARNVRRQAGVEKKPEQAERNQWNLSPSLLPGAGPAHGEKALGLRFGGRIWVVAATWVDAELNQLLCCCGQQVAEPK